MHVASLKQLSMYCSVVWAAALTACGGPTFVFDEVPLPRQKILLPPPRQSTGFPPVSLQIQLRFINSSPPILPAASLGVYSLQKDTPRIYAQTSARSAQRKQQQRCS
jgi:hypothetical protein